jgi:glutamine synthetase
MYSHRLNVEALSMLEIASTSILPVAIDFQRKIADSIKSVSEVSPKIDLRSQLELLEQVSGEIGRLQGACQRLRLAQGEAEHGPDSHQSQAESFRDNVLPAMQQLRASSDLLEGLVDDELWPLPKYREMLFIS